MKPLVGSAPRDDALVAACGGYQHGRAVDCAFLTNPFRSIEAVSYSGRELVFRGQAIIDVDRYEAQFADKQSTKQFFILKSADAPPTTMIKDDKRASS